MNNKPPYVQDGQSIFGEPEGKEAGISIETQKFSLAEKILKHYWDSTKPFRKLRELKDNHMEFPVGEEAWRIFKIFRRNQFESELPFPDKVASETGMDEKTMEELYALADKENQR